ncbi:Porin [Paraburkholderia unamae]|uniref:porin n=1 Tax=Paraburkholderia unamae TaxID=219649 RepID=UPI001CAAED89|nr:porin [Paraburkholderia unamae]CAG9245947.1 Porin [Paraburkholderia unamae]
MKKSVKSGIAIFAGSITLVASSAHAQSDVTLYGVLDVGVMYTSKTPGANGKNAGSSLSIENGGYLPSFFGVKGKEDLGGGYDANFDLQSGIDLGNGGFDNNLAGSFFGRESWVGVSGRFGEVRAGVQYSAFEEAMFELDPRGFEQMGTLVTLYSANSITGTFSSNAIEYRSPNLYGLRGIVMTCIGGHPGNFREGFCYSGMLSYEIGRLKIVAGAIDEAADDGTETTNPGWAFERQVIAKTVGATYNFQSVRVVANYTTFRAPELLSNSSGANDVYNIGADWYVTPTIDLNGSVAWVQDPNHSRTHALQVSSGLSYYLSKRTSFYGQFAVVDNKGNEHIGPTMENGNLVGVSGTTFAADIGIRHMF